MRYTILAVLVLCLHAAASRADVSTALVEIPNGLGPAAATFDLIAQVTGGDQWTSTSMKGNAKGCQFFQHHAGYAGPPNLTLFGVFPTLPWDTFVTMPEAWPNTPEQGHAPSWQGGCSMSQTTIDMLWFDTPPNRGDGDWVLARISIENLTPGWTVTLQGAHTTLNGGSILFPFTFVVPEPGTAALLAAGVGLMVAAVRRAGAHG